MKDTKSVAPDSTVLTPPGSSNRITYSDILQARQTLRRHFQATPLVYSDFLSDSLNAEVYLKRDDLVPTGAFKLRGGLVLAAELSNSEDPTTLITASTGNHGQSISFAGRELGVPVEIVVPEDANDSKVDAMQRLGATVRHHGSSMDEAFVWAQTRADEQGFRFVHPAHEPEIIAGVATAGLEVIEELPEVDFVFSPVGSGSYASGWSLTAGKLCGAEVIGVQSEGADAVYQAWDTGRIESIDEVDTFAEGIAIGTPFKFTVQILDEYLADFLRVTDEDLREAMRRVIIKEHILAEAAGIASVAGAYAYRDQLSGSTVVLPICGRNISVKKLCELIEEFN